MKKEFMKVVQRSGISQLCRNYITAAEWTDLIINLTSTLVSSRNYNSFASQVGATIFNIASMLADMERNMFLDTDYTYSLKRPHARALQGENEEEDENIFIQYVSISEQGDLVPKKFHANKDGPFIGELFDTVHEGSRCTRPTKSCQPDFILEYQGVPLGYGEVKSNPFDSKEGLSYMTMCTANILNFAYPAQPAIVMHSNNRKFHIQTVKVNLDDGELVVKERLGTPYSLVPDGDDFQCQHHKDEPIQNVVILKDIAEGMQLKTRDCYALSGNMPLLYMYERFPISQVGDEIQAFNPRHGYLQFHAQVPMLLEAERRKSLDEQFNVRDYYHSDVPVEARSHDTEHVYFHPYYPNHYL